MLIRSPAFLNTGSGIRTAWSCGRNRRADGDETTSTIPHINPYGYAYKAPRGFANPGSWGAAWLKESLTKLAKRIAKAERVRRDMRRLSEMDDRMLRDIGLARSEIERAVRGGRW